MDRNLYHTLLHIYLLDGSTTAKPRTSLPQIIRKYGIQSYQFQFNNFDWISLWVLEVLIEIVYLLMTIFLDLVIIPNYSPILI